MYILLYYTIPYHTLLYIQREGSTGFRVSASTYKNDTTKIMISMCICESHATINFDMIYKQTLRYSFKYKYTYYNPPDSLYTCKLFVPYTLYSLY